MVVGVDPTGTESACSQDAAVCTACTRRNSHRAYNGVSGARHNVCTTPDPYPLPYPHLPTRTPMHMTLGMLTVKMDVG